MFGCRTADGVAGRNGRSLAVHIFPPRLVISDPYQSTDFSRLSSSPPLLDVIIVGTFFIVLHVSATCARQN